MLIMILELLAVSFILGMGITAVVLVTVSGVDLLRAKHATAAGAEIGRLEPRPLGVLRAQRGDSSPGQRRAA
jgi:hypothetical protein